MRLRSNLHRSMAYAALVLGFLALVYASTLAFSLPFFLLAIALLTSSAVLLKLGDWLLPSLLSKAMLHPVYEDIEFLEDAILVWEEDGYSASGFLELSIARSIADMKENEKTLFISAFHNFLASADYGFKISLVMAPENISQELTRVRVKAEELLYKAAKARADGDRLREKKLEEERRYWKDQEKRLASERPFDIAFYAQVTAKAPEAEAALARMRAERKKITGGLASSLGVDAIIVKGRDLYKYARLNLVVPPTSKELKRLEW
jgi:hypothetical protein